MILVTIKDTLSGQFGAVRTTMNDLTAVRDFRQLLSGNDKISAGDFELYKLADYEPENGSISNTCCEFICNGVSALGGKVE